MYIYVCMFWFFSPCQSMTSWLRWEPILPAPTNMKHLAMSASPTNHGVDKLWPTKWCCQTGKQIAKGCVVLWEKIQLFDGVCHVSGTWGLRFPRAKNICKWFQLHHPERMLVCHTKSSMCFQHFLWNWYQSWSQMPCQTRVSGSHINQKSCPRLSKVLLFYTSCNKNSWIPLLWSYGLVLLPTSKSSSQVFFPEKPTTFSRAGWFPTVITCHSPTFCHANQGPGPPNGGSKSFAAKFATKTCLHPKDLNDLGAVDTSLRGFSRIDSKNAKSGRNRWTNKSLPSSF